MNSLGLVCTEASCCVPCDKPWSESGEKGVCLCACVQMCYKYLVETDSENLWKLLNSFGFGKWDLEKGGIIWKESKNLKKCLSSGNFLIQTSDCNWLVIAETTEKRSKFSRENIPGVEARGCSLRPEGKGEFTNCCLNFHFFLTVILVL